MHDIAPSDLTTAPYYFDVDLNSLTIVSMDAIQLISDPHRREILRLVWNDELSAGDLASHFDISFGAVSQHLRRLREARLVTVRRDGNYRYYRADSDRLAPYAPMLEAMWSGYLQDLARRAEAGE